jgi:ankyrin repeat protein
MFFQSRGLDNWTGLHFASNEGHDEIVLYLLGKKANIEAKTGLGRRPLHIASIRGNLKVVNILYDSGADINVLDNEFNTPLHHACEFEFSSIVDFFLEKKAKIDVKNYKGLSAIDICNNLGIRKKFEALGLIDDEELIKSYGRTVFGNTVRSNARFNYVENILFLSNQNRKM